VFERFMDDLVEGKAWARTVAFVVCVTAATLGIWIATGIVLIDPFDAF